MVSAQSIFYRAYTLVEASVDYESAIEDLITLASGRRDLLQQARRMVDELGVVGDPGERAEVAGLAGWDDDVAEFETYQRKAVQTLLEEAAEAA